MSVKDRDRLDRFDPADALALLAWAVGPPIVFAAHEARCGGCSPLGDRQFLGLVYVPGPDDLAEDDEHALWARAIRRKASARDRDVERGPNGFPIAIHAIGRRGALQPDVVVRDRIEARCRRGHVVGVDVAELFRMTLDPDQVVVLRPASVRPARRS